MPDRNQAPATTDVTRLLRAHAAGDAAALDALLPRVYDELRRIAAARLRSERGGHTLTPTDVVNEAFLKLLPLPSLDWNGRTHFYAVASRVMRNVLIDHAERRSALKRGGGAAPLTLHPDMAAAPVPVDDLIALGLALQRLERLDERQARIVECRFFGGLSIDETAAALGISAATVSREWTLARAWLHRELTAPPTE
jgi:RNA polymerase sigma factor (TIGR02999 family)